MLNAQLKFFKKLFAYIKDNCAPYNLLPLFWNQDTHKIVFIYLKHLFAALLPYGAQGSSIKYIK